MKIILTGTSGHLGSRVLSSLLDHATIPSTDLIISTTSPHNVSAIAKQNDITLISGDFRDASALNSAFAASGADTLFLVSYPSPSVERWLYHKNAIDAAKASGTIRLIVYTSLMFGGETGMISSAGVQQAHIRTIEYLQQSGMEYVVLRQGIYAESWWLYAGFIDWEEAKKRDVVDFVVPNDGPVAWVGWDDLGEGTARILEKLWEGDREWVGKTLNLTGAKTMTLKGVAEALQQTTGKTVNVNVVGREEAKKYHSKKGGKEHWVVDSWSGWHDAIAEGECAVVDPLLGELIERKPQSIEELAEILFA